MTCRAPCQPQPVCDAVILTEATFPTTGSSFQVKAVASSNSLLLTCPAWWLSQMPNWSPCIPLLRGARQPRLALAGSRVVCLLNRSPGRTAGMMCGPEASHAGNFTYSLRVRRDT